MRPRTSAFVAAAALAMTTLAAPAAAQTSAAPEQPQVHRLTAQVSADRLRADVTAMVGFGTRHTLSDTVSETRGIGAARRWVQRQFEDISRDCGGCLEVITPSAVVTGPRIPDPTEVVNVVAIQRGTTDPDRVILISGHLDSRVSDVMNFTDDAPGANDDASGVAALIEAARVLSTERFPATLVYAALTGEEQGLHGARIVAEYAKAQGWDVLNLNNDMVGNVEGQSGNVDTTRIRVFAEGTRTVETPAQANRRRYNGGEVDSPSRNLARFIDSVADRYMTNFDVEVIYRTDRFSRGGDQVEFLRAGYPAVRITEGSENYDRQHQDLRTESGRVYGDTLDGVNWPYLAQATRLNVAVMAALASAPRPPTGVTLSGAVTADTTLSWQPVPGAVGYRVWWRATTAPDWTHHRDAGDATRLTLPGVVIDDYFFGVSAIGEGGWESPVVFPGDPGDFYAPETPAPDAR
jgi:Zn-dependent M28 family amino/carboxypeptidase